MIEIVFDVNEEAVLAAVNSNVSEKEKIDIDPKNIICLSGMLDIGNIKEPIYSECRKQTLFEMNENSVVKDCEKEWNYLLENFERLKTCAKQGDTFRIWYSDAPYSICGFHYICYFLENYECEIHSVKLPASLIVPDGLMTFSSMRELNPALLHHLLPLEKKLLPIEIMHYAMAWKEIMAYECPLRAVINGELTGVPVDFYDFMIRRELPNEEIRFVDLVGKVLAHNQMTVFELWINSRVYDLIKNKEIKVIKEVCIRELVIQKA